MHIKYQIKIQCNENLHSDTFIQILVRQSTCWQCVLFWRTVQTRHCLVYGVYICQFSIASSPSLTWPPTVTGESLAIGRLVGRCIAALTQKNIQWTKHRKQSNWTKYRVAICSFLYIQDWPSQRSLGDPIIAQSWSITIIIWFTTKPWYDYHLAISIHLLIFYRLHQSMHHMNLHSNFFLPYLHFDSMRPKQTSNTT